MNRRIAFARICCFGFFLGWGFLTAEEEVPVGDPPVSHIWDRDDIFRSSAEVKEEISEALLSLERNYGMAVYLVVSSAQIGEKPLPFAMRCHAEWLGERNDGLEIVLSANGSTSGVVGRSNPLYEGQLLEEGLMPRVPYVELQSIVENGIRQIKEESEQVERMKVFTLTIVESLGDRLSLQDSSSTGRDKLKFMGWMSLVLVIAGLLVGLISKIVGSAEKRFRRTYRFPEFTVPQRLKASNGGGKVSVIDFELPPSSGGR